MFFQIFARPDPVHDQANELVRLWCDLPEHAWPRAVALVRTKLEMTASSK